jgi:hypothetical protein
VAVISATAEKMSFQTILCDTGSFTARITLNRPTVLNVLRPCGRRACVGLPNGSCRPRDPGRYPDRGRRPFVHRWSRHLRNRSGYSGRSGARWILLVAAQRKDWPGFVKAIGKPKLLDDPRFSDENRAANAAALVEILDPLFASQPLAYWKQVLDAGRVIFGVVQVAHEILNDPQLAANDIVVPLELPDQPPSGTVNSPIQIIGAEKVKPGAALRLGEHGEDILQELGFSASEIAQLHGSGAVAPFQSSPPPGLRTQSRRLATLRNPPSLSDPNGTEILLDRPSVRPSTPKRHA